MAACSQEAALERVSGVKIQQLCERKGGKGDKKKYSQLQEKTRSKPREKWETCKHLQRKLLKKVKRLHNLGRHVCASGSRNKCTDEAMGGGGGEIESIHSSVCVSGVWSSVKPVPGAVCMRLFVDLFVCDCIPDTRHNYLVIFVEILLLILQQVLHCLLAIATDEWEEGEYLKKKYLCQLH